MKDLLDSLKNVILLLLILWVSFTFLLGIKMAPNDDMKPRISAGDILFYYRLNTTPSIREVIVLNKNGTDYIGRVVARAGDKVEITKDASLIINDNMVIEDMIYYSTPYYEGYLEYPVTLKENEYFILVDQREGGEDSRYYGVVNKKDIKGIVFGQFRRNNL